MVSADLKAAFDAMRTAYKAVGPTGYDMRKCFQGQRHGGNITINYQCAKKGGELIGQKIRALVKSG